MRERERERENERQSKIQLNHARQSLPPPSTENGTECVPCIMTTRPNATEFELFIQYFLDANPNATCASGGHAAFGDAVILKDNTTVTSESCDFHVTVMACACVSCDRGSWSCDCIHNTVHELPISHDLMHACHVTGICVT